jgi:hypothetical protein
MYRVWFNDKFMMIVDAYDKTEAKEEALKCLRRWRDDRRITRVEKL